MILVIAFLEGRAEQVGHVVAVQISTAFVHPRRLALVSLGQVPAVPAEGPVVAEAVSHEGRRAAVRIHKDPPTVGKRGPVVRAVGVKYPV